MSYFLLVTLPLVLIATVVLARLFKIPLYIVAAAVLIILGTTWLFG